MLLIDRSENRQTTSDGWFGDGAVADHQCRCGRWRRPMPAGALDTDTTLTCPFDEPHLIAGGRQPNIQVKARGNTCRNRIRQRHGDRSKCGVTSATVDRPNPTEIPCESTCFDGARSWIASP